MKVSFTVSIVMFMVALMIPVASDMLSVSADAPNTCSIGVSCEPTKTPKPTITKTVKPTDVPPTLTPIPPTDVPPTNTAEPTDPPKIKKTKTPEIPFVYNTPVPTEVCMSECEFRETVVDLLRRILVELQVLNLKDG